MIITGLSMLSTYQIREELIHSGLFSANCQFETIQGGVINQAYALMDKQTHYFVKVFACEEMLNINREVQFNQQKQLALAGLAPYPCYLSSAHSFQVDEWVQGQTLLEVELSPMQKYQYLAKTLANVHSIKNTSTLNLTSLDLPHKWREYAANSEENLNIPDIKYLETRWYAMTQEHSCVCHNDMSLQHVLVGDSETVFDWEYAAYSSPYFDIASSLLINSTSAWCEDILLNEYASITGILLSKVEQNVALMKPIANLTNQLWFAATKSHPTK